MKFDNIVGSHTHTRVYKPAQERTEEQACRQVICLAACVCVGEGVRDRAAFHALNNAIKWY